MCPVAVGEGGVSARDEEEQEEDGALSILRGRYAILNRNSPARRRIRRHFASPSLSVCQWSSISATCHRLARRRRRPPTHRRAVLADKRYRTSGRGEPPIEKERRLGRGIEA